jgi:hypothetical protein
MGLFLMSVFYLTLAVASFVFGVDRFLGWMNKNVRQDDSKAPGSSEPDTAKLNT